MLHCGGGNVEPWKRTHVHQPRDFISHWKSTANAARGGGQSLARCVRMWNAKCERAAASKSCAAPRCSAVRSAALQLVVCCCDVDDVKADVASRRLLKCPPPPLKANCRKLPAAMIQLNCLHCVGVRKSKRERESVRRESGLVCVSASVCVVWALLFDFIFTVNCYTRL